jgi:4-hydroxybenzoate polyprenyltransferase
MKPLIIFKGKKRKFTDEKWDGACYDSSASGWMNTEIFNSWFKGVFIPEANSHRPEGYDGPIFLILDGHTSHTNIDLIIAARLNNIELICLPSHSSHILQPLDISIFGPLKKFWSSIVRDFEAKNNRKVN